MENLNPNKEELRRSLRQLRDSIPLNRRQEASQGACKHLLTASDGKALIASYAPFGTELSLNPFNEQLVNEGRLLLPKVIEKHLSFYKVTDPTHLVKGKGDLLEPSAELCELIPPAKINLILVPGLGFDVQTKHRIGYGKGYYDRFILENPALEYWGIGFFEQSLINLPHSAHDQALTKILLY